MKVAITGCNGFIGSHLVNYLKDLGYIVDNIDIKDETSVKSRTYNVIVHLAQPSCLNNHGYNEETICNALKQLQLIISSARRVIYISSSSVYRIEQGDNFLIEDSRTDVHDDYSKLKLHSEDMIMKNCCSYAILRLALVYGPGMTSKGFVGSCIKKIINEQSPVIMVESPDTQRDFVHIYDVCTSIEKCIRTSGNYILNIGYGRSYRLDYVFRMLAKMMGKDIEIMAGRMPRSDVNVCIDAAKRNLGWRPCVNIEMGLKTLIT
jgi:nucleoside-diphosphate-sugar epimerase